MYFLRIDYHEILFPYSQNSVRKGDFLLMGSNISEDSSAKICCSTS
jgi:hypothetical protein